MFNVGDIIQYTSVESFIHRVVRIIDRNSIETEVIETHDPGGWPVGKRYSWNPENFRLFKLPTSSCGCYWDHHPLLCICKKG